MDAVVVLLGVLMVGTTLAACLLAITVEGK